MPQKRTDKNGKTRWIGRYRDKNKKEYTRSFPTRREAKQWEDERKTQVTKGTHVTPQREKTTILEMYDAWTTRDLADGTLLSYAQTRRELQDSIGAAQAIHTTVTDINKWHLQLINGRPWMDNKTLARTTAREHMVRLSSAFNFAIREGWLYRNPVMVPPAATTTAVKAKEIPTLDEIQSLITQVETGGSIYQGYSIRRGKSVPDTFTSQPAPVVADMMRLGVGSGLRISEVCGLIVSDINVCARELHVTAQIHREGKRRVALKTKASERVVPLADDALELLGKYTKGKDPDDWVFATKCGTPYRASSLGGAIRHASRHLGVEWTFHSLRHLYASRLIAAGVPVNVVQKLMGHASATVTLDTYTHLWPKADDVARSAIAGAVAACGQNAGKGGV
ncbi:tyrosine-type recombinase/integrase [Corynebacterium ulcerans]|uniref:tyrosine-type recombinase/integrase n=1 Tax=Corynebacterium ulcerans TaxID=65058 RepID=UPI0002141C79|nr:tyrosine-type recombinase/integrase [Corynebacterium ulcerans]AEG81719.1 tyrosine recombinase [Corynebacterium ulcerans 809]AEG83909.1 tyrosine recombinase [Corynebacterium ulcerans BR-AD22]PLW03630.1 recombinase [Corynebacterium ulcerans]